MRNWGGRNQKERIIVSLIKIAWKPQTYTQKLHRFLGANAGDAGPLFLVIGFPSGSRFLQFCIPGSISLWIQPDLYRAQQDDLIAPAGYLTPVLLTPSHGHLKEILSIQALNTGGWCPMTRKKHVVGLPVPSTTPHPRVSRFPWTFLRVPWSTKHAEYQVFFIDLLLCALTLISVTGKE